MSETPVSQITSDPNFMLILVGAIIWMLGEYNIFLIGPLCVVIGFAMTASAIAISSLQRQTDKAVFGLLVGGVIQLAGYYIAWIPLVGWLIAPPLIVLGGVMIMFFAIPLAIQTGKVPFIEEIRAQIKKDEKSPSTTDSSEASEDTSTSE